MDHLLLCYLATAEGDDALRAASALADVSGAELTVVLPVLGGASARTCCGIQPAAWDRMLDEDTQAAARRASDALGRDVWVETGRSLESVLGRVAGERGCDVVALPRKRRPWSTGGWSRRVARRITRRTGLPTIALGGPSSQVSGAS